MKRIALAILCIPSVALAGGFERLENGVEALGRGAAFVAKADDASAIIFNPAGLARLRGTHTLLDLNLVDHTYEFTRAGTYPEDGSAYPTVHQNGDSWFGGGGAVAPFLGITSDFGIFDRWTFAIGLYAPSSYGGRNYPAGLADGRPAPQRYDVIHEDLLILFPTLAAAVRVTKWLDLGLDLHLVYAHFNLSNVAFVDLGRRTCPNDQTPLCDSLNTVDTSGFTATFSLGAMFHPIKPLSIGLSLRGPTYIDTTGHVSAVPPKAMSQLQVSPAPAEFHSRLPWVLRLGVRWAFLKEGFEQGDVEIDGVYEAWSEAHYATDADGNTGDQAKIPLLANIFTDVNPVIAHNYQDTFSVRLGGSYNIKLPVGLLSLRAGFYFDSAATKYKDTRLDFDTMAKYSPTVGLTYRVRGIGIRIAYAYVWSPDRTVTNGDIRSLNGTNGTNYSSVNVPGSTTQLQPLPVINNGHYHAESHVLGIGIDIAWDEALKRTRKLKYD